MLVNTFIEREHILWRENTFFTVRRTACIQVRVLAAMPLISCPPPPPPPSLSLSLLLSLSLSLCLALSVSLRAGPFLNFLALHEQRKQENSEKLEALKMTFWPFAVAGGFL
jgi:hypothetical protein